MNVSYETRPENAPEIPRQRRAGQAPSEHPADVPEVAPPGLSSDECFAIRMTRRDIRKVNRAYRRDRRRFERTLDVVVDDHASERELRAVWTFGH